MTSDHQFDQLLDDALGEYRDREPVSGLEDRVLQRLWSQTAESRRWWNWGAIATCTALILIGAGIEIGRRSPTAPSTHPLWGQVGPPATARSNANSQSQAIAPRPVRQHPSVTPADRRNAFAFHARAGAPTRTAITTSQFPTPTPFTAEEHALLTMLHANPDALPKPEENSADTTIAPLEIKPLAGSAVSTQENSNE
jgi:hypothetical protein